jgi:uncharacterized protein
MAGASLLTLLDDIASVLDDVATMTKVAAKKTAGVLGDDLALNAQQVSGVHAERELPVVWAVAKGSIRNKLILVPAALLISALAPWAVTPLLMVGGLFLCYEGFEKLAHRALHRDDDEHARHLAALADQQVDMVAFERDKIKGAVRTDFILSAEIIVISLGTVADAAFGTRVAVLAGIAAIMTIGVYGLVAGIVKLDDAGAFLNQRSGAGAWQRLQRRLGRVILQAAPAMMKSLSVIGTAAMFMVGGSILTHGVPALHHWIEDLTHGLAASIGAGGLVQGLISTPLDALVGMIAGALALLLVMLASRVLAAVRKKPAEPNSRH